MTKTHKKKIRKRNGNAQDIQNEGVLSVLDADVLQKLVGTQDRNIKSVEKLLDVRVGRSEQGLSILGTEADVELAHDLLSQLAELIATGEKVFPGDIERAVNMLSSNRRLRLKDIYRDKVEVAGRASSIVPKSIQQKNYIEAIRANDVVFGIGPAGTGKTYLAMAMAVAALVNKQVKRVVLCRPAVEAGEKLGFLPGDMAEKVNPYLRPLYDALHDMVEYDKAHEMVERGQIEVAPLAFMRGRTLSNAFVILDEAQNTTASQMKMFLTRLGLGSKCVVTGDTTQIDLPRGQVSGLNEALRILREVKGISTVRFSRDDVVRHRLVSRIIDAYQEHDEGEEL